MDKQSRSTIRDEGGCNKKAPRHPELLPGLMCVCCPHGLCLGYEVMAEHESPKQVMRLLVERFVDPGGPRIHVVYDNACHLYEYVLNRMPSLVANTRFHTDRLHEVNHTSCALSYRMRLDPEMDEVNSQACEQLNRLTGTTTSQASQMTMDHFMVFHAALYALYNDRKRAAILDLPFILPHMKHLTN